MDKKQASLAVDRHWGIIIRQCRVTLDAAYGRAQEADVEDCAQSAIVMLLSSALPRFKRGRGTVKGFIKVCTRNHCHNYVKSACRAKPHDHVDTTDGDITAVSLTSAVPSATAVCERASDHAALKRAICTLDRRDAFIMSELASGRGRKETAQFLNRSAAWMTIQTKAITAQLCKAVK